MKAIFTSFLIFIAISVQAQNKFVQGYYVTNQQDSVSCFIENKNWSKNPKTIIVSGSGKQGDTQTKSIEQLQAFGLTGGDIYERFVLPVNKSRVHENMIKVTTPQVVETDTVFMKVMAKGSLNLYYLKSESGKEHLFVQEGAGQPKELLLLKNKVEVNGLNYMTQEEAFKDTLQSMMVGCEAIKSKISALRFSTKAIRNLVVGYNECKPSATTPTYVAPDEKFETEIALMAGGFSTALKFTGDDKNELVKTAFDGTGYTAGVAFNFVVPRLHQRWSIYTELLWKAYSVTGDYEERISSENYFTSSSKIGVQGIGLTAMLRYQLKERAVKPFINAGVANNFVFNHTNEKVINRNFYSVQSEKTVEAVNGIRKHEQAWVVGAGLSYKNMITEFRLERGNGVSEVQAIGSPKTMFGIMLGYQLK
ncbi:porin family protein [Pontibacter arcticus]|uniref:Outer membrane protein beta-barrel domain-containing protein n=1 Tax=Pontibacter arcticus TaxID=2080288 RepID=A0A364RGF8_9BACT|nr:outer membrane beta-barrel protein [Pontibacter arcticus]RAU83363.1 hypothetical protein DP923_09165 [Pontibacter arcticus]